MARPPSNMPEGTDAIIPGASADDDDANEFTIDGTRPVEGEAGDGFAMTHGQKFDPIPVEELASPGGGEGGSDGSGSGEGLRATAQRVVGEKTAGLRDQAAEKARAFALQGKDRATDALDNVVRMVEDAAATVDDKVGAQYGDYIRRAAGTLDGVASQLRDKDVDDLLADVRETVRKNPAIAIGAAAAVGFLIARIVKVGAAAGADAAAETETA